MALILVSSSQAMIRPLTCPICRKQLPVAETERTVYFPFCSQRCRDVDLLRWSDGRYAIVDPLDAAVDELDEPLPPEEDW